jgi:hypothetical protein
VKLPAKKINLAKTIESLGFSFIETMLSLSLSIRKNDPNILRVNYKIMTETELECLYEHYLGGMSDKDRVSLDPHFTVEQAGRRYVGWIKDELARGADCLGLIVGNEIVGFTIGRKHETFCDFILSGVYPEHQGSGLLHFLVQCQKKHAIDNGINKLMGSISTNNLPSLIIQLRAGYIPTNATYVFVRHM